jgi:hypothetical protein
MKTLTSTSATCDLNTDIAISDIRDNILLGSLLSGGINTYTKGCIDFFEPILTARLDSAEYYFKPFFLTEEEAMDIENKIYQKKKSEYLLEKELQGKYIAQINGEIIDKDNNFSELAKRVYETHGYKSIFMTQVTPEKKHKLSPKFKRPA